MGSDIFREDDAGPGRKTRDRAEDIRAYRKRLEHYDDRMLLGILGRTTGDYRLAALMTLEDRGYSAEELGK